MKTLEIIVHWINKILPWILIPTLIFGAIIVGLLWGETKKSIRS